MLKSVLKERQHSILHPERIVGKPEFIQKRASEKEVRVTGIPGFVP
jgi:hypothetical protein